MKSYPPPPKSGRRFAIGAALVLLLLSARLLASAAVVAEGKTRLFAFVLSEQKSRKVQAALQGDMPGVAVTVFGNAQDFKMRVQDDGPDAVLAPSPVLESLGLEVGARGVLGGEIDESYVVVTLGEPRGLEQLKGETVGVFGLLPRQQMKVFAGALLGTGSQRVRPVTKLVDLLPLLRFRIASAVLVPRRFVPVVAGPSQLSLVVRELPGARVGLSSVSFPNPKAEAPVRAALGGLGPVSLKQLGVDGWK